MNTMIATGTEALEFVSLRLLQPVYLVPVLICFSVQRSSVRTVAIPDILEWEYLISWPQEGMTGVDTLEI